MTDARLVGYVASPLISRRDNKGIRLFVNGRVVQDRTLSMAVQIAYRTLLEIGRKPICALNIEIDPHLVDATIGFSVAWKAFDNLGGFKTLFGVQPDNRAVVFGFGLVHGFGLATKLQALRLNPNGLVVNLVSFNMGVEIGQIIALSVILLAMAVWRRTRWFNGAAAGANVLLMVAGFVLAGQQIAGYVLGGGV